MKSGQKINQMYEEVETLTTEAWDSRYKRSMALVGSRSKEEKKIMELGLTTYNLQDIKEADLSFLTRELRQWCRDFMAKFMAIDDEFPFLRPADLPPPPQNAHEELKRLLAVSGEHKADRGWVAVIILFSMA